MAHGKALIITASQSSHTPPRRRGRGGDAPDDSRRPLLRCVAGGRGAVARNAVGRRDKCSEIRNRDSPSDRLGTPPADSFRQTDCCVPLKAISQSVAQFVATLLGTLARCLCPRV